MSVLPPGPIHVTQARTGHQSCTFYYAEQVRENVTYDFNDKDGGAQIKAKLGQYLSDARSLAQAMGQFLDELLSAYTKMYDLDSKLTHRSVKE